MDSVEKVTVQGTEVQAIGLGTGRMAGEVCAEAVETALELGYRRIDTAQMYGNEDAVGRGIERSDVPRENAFVTTKLNRSIVESMGYTLMTGKPLETGVRRGNLNRDRVTESVEGSLKRLGTSYVDLLLIHAPGTRVPLRETLGAMNRLRKEGKVRNIGVSNFSPEQLERATEASAAPVLSNQVRHNVFYDQTETLEACVENDVMLTAYTPLNRGRGLDNDLLVEIGERHDKTPAQVVLRWLLQQENVSAIPKASKSRRRRDGEDRRAKGGLRRQVEVGSPRLSLLRVKYHKIKKCSNGPPVRVREERRRQKAPLCPRRVRRRTR
jgi:diketogulonate reductase-like aldo/keto reductase